MAYEHVGIDITRKSSGDMSSHQYKLVSFSTTNDGEGCILATVRKQVTHGVWQGPKSTQAEFGKVRVLGVTKVAAGDSSAMDVAITVGMQLEASSNGHAIPSTAGTASHGGCGYALQPLGTGSTGIITIFAIPILNSTTT